jgi:hypothetical protein
MENLILTEYILIVFELSSKVPRPLNIRPYHNEGRGKGFTCHTDSSAVVYPRMVYGSQKPVIGFFERIIDWNLHLELKDSAYWHQAVGSRTVPSYGDSVGPAM